MNHQKRWLSNHDGRKNDLSTPRCDEDQNNDPGAEADRLNAEIAALTELLRSSADSGSANDR